MDNNSEIPALPLSTTIIRDKSKTCTGHFQTCLRAPDLNDENSIWLEQKSAEFNWWVTALDADKLGPGCLDARLILRPDVREVVVDVLDGLSDALKLFRSISLQEKTARNTDPLADEILDDGDPSYTSSGPVGHDAGGEHESELDEEDRSPSPWSDMISQSSSNNRSTVSVIEAVNNKATLDEYHEQRIYIDTSLDVLMRIYTAIKRSGLKFRNKRADNARKRAEDKYRSLKANFGDNVALADPAGDHELFRRYLTRLILSNGYTNDLLERLAMEVRMGHEGAHINSDGRKAMVLIVLRAYFRDPSRLTTVQHRLVELNVVRRSRLSFAGSVVRKQPQTELPHLQEQHVNRPSLLDETLLSVAVNPQLPEGEVASVADRSSAPPSRFQSNRQPETTDIQSAHSFVAVPATELESNFSITAALAPARTNRSAATKMSARIEYLDYPKCPANSGYFPCPYCPLLLADDYCQKDKWRAHVAQDLLPYACVFEDCDSPNEMYTSTYQWMNHMAQAHSDVEWVCRECELYSGLHDMANYTFDTAERLVTHLIASHPSIERSVFELLVHSAKRTKGIQLVGCPLCRAGLVSSDDKSVETCIDPATKSTSDSSQRKLALIQLEDDDHIASHIHEFALQSIPWSASDQMQDINSSDALSRNSPLLYERVFEQDAATAQPSIYTQDDVINRLGHVKEQLTSLQNTPLPPCAQKMKGELDDFISRSETLFIDPDADIDTALFEINTIAILATEILELSNADSQDSEESDTLWQFLSEQVAALTTRFDPRRRFPAEAPKYDTKTDSRPLKERKRLFTRYQTIKELIHTESLFIREMIIVEEIYKGTASAAPLEESDVKTIFRNIDEIIAFHTEFAEEMKKGVTSVYPPNLYRNKPQGPPMPSDGSEQSDVQVLSSFELNDEKDRETSLGSIFSKNMEAMIKVHETFSKNSDHAVKRLLQTQVTPLKLWLDECDEAIRDLTNARNLDGLLARPMQRITKYSTLLFQLLSETPYDHPDRHHLVFAKNQLDISIEAISKTKKNFELVKQIVSDRKRKDSEARGGLARAFGKSVARSQPDSRPLDEDAEWNKLLEEFQENILRLHVTLRDIEFYTRQISEYVQGFLQLLSSMELVMRLQPSPWPEIESKWVVFNTSMRDIQKVALVQHLSQVRKAIIEPLELILKSYDNPSLALKERSRLRPDYDKSIQLKKNGKKVDKQTANSAMQYAALNEMLSKELPQLLNLTAKMGRCCLSHFVCIQADWYKIWKDKTSLVLDGRHTPEISDIINAFSRDYWIWEDKIKESGILKAGSTGDLSQSTGRNILPSLFQQYSRDFHSEGTVASASIPPSQAPVMVTEEPQSSWPIDPASHASRTLSNPSSQEREPINGYNVLWNAASLFEFDLETGKTEAGFPYLTYQAGEIFDVIGEAGELWLSKNQNDPTNQVGWTWSKHFAKLADE